MITPKTPSKKPASLRGFLFKTLLFDAAMRITPPLSIFALAITGAAVYKVSPEKARKTIKSTVLDLRNQLSEFNEFKILYPTQGNEIFVKMSNLSYENILKVVDYVVALQKPNS